jgi:hypothetical protein
LLFSIHAKSQEQKLKTDSVATDTSLWVNGTKKDLPKLSLNIKPFKPDPKKAVMYSLIFPGLGQIYNRKYWKLPLVYGGFIGLTYAVTWNGKYYNDYSKAYKDIMSSDPVKNDSWVDFLKPRITDASQVTSAELTQYRSIFKRQKNFYRRNRDLSIIGMVGLYALCAIDAYIDAQLFDFDISDNVSMRVEPAVIPSQSARVADNALGVNCSIKF